MDDEFEIQDLLETGYSLNLVVSTGHKELEIPDYLYTTPTVVLEIGYNLTIPIPDLNLAEDGIYCTLSFNKTPYMCFIPYDSIIECFGDALDVIEKSRKLDIVKNTPQSNVPRDIHGKIIKPSWLRVVK